MSFNLRTLLLALWLTPTCALAVDPNLVPCLDEKVIERAWVDTRVPGLYDAIPGKNEIKIGALEIKTQKSKNTFETDLLWMDGSKTTTEFFNPKAYEDLMYETLIRAKGASERYNDISWEAFWATSKTLLSQKVEALKKSGDFSNEKKIMEDPEILAITAKLMLPVWENSVFFTARSWTKGDVMRRWRYFCQADRMSVVDLNPDQMKLLQYGVDALFPSEAQILGQKNLFETREVDTQGGGNFKRDINPQTKTIVFNNANLNIAPELGTPPNWIKPTGVPELVSGKGVPTHLYVTLNQMKLAGIKPGELKHGEISNITNMETAVAIRNSPEFQTWLKANPKKKTVPGSLLATIFLKTPTGRYVQTVLTQSGHKIKGVFIEDTKIETLNDLSRRIYSTTEEGNRLAQDLPRDTPMPGAIKKVYLDLEPL